VEEALGRPTAPPTSRFVALLCGSVMLVALFTGMNWAGATDASDPAVDLELSGYQSSAATAADGQVIYNLTVSTNSSDRARSIVVRDEVPLGAELIAATTRTLTGVVNDCAQAGRVVSCHLPDSTPSGYVTITLRPMSEGTLVNSATVTASNGDPNPANNTLSFSAAVTARTTAIHLHAYGQPDPVAVGAPLTYTAQLSNAGPSYARGVSIRGELPPDVEFLAASSPEGASCSVTGGIFTCALADVAPSAYTRLSVETRAPLGPGSISARFEASTTTPQSTTNTNVSLATTEVIPPAADVTSAVRPVENPAGVGYPSRFSVTSGNRGPTTARDTTLTVAPVGAELVSVVLGPSEQGPPVPCDRDGTALVCRLGEVEARRSIQFLATIIPSAAGPTGITVRTSSATPDPLPANNEATSTVDAIAPQADLRVTTRDSPSDLGLRDPFAFRAEFHNDGPTTAMGVVATMNLPEGVVFQEVSRYPSVSGLPSCSLADRTVTCALGDFGRGQSASVDVRVLASAPGSYSASASVTSSTADPVNGNNSASHTVKLVSSKADLSVAVHDSPDPVVVGEELRYDVRISNGGPTQASNVVLVDELSPDVRFLSLSADPGMSCVHVAPQVRCTVAELLNGRTARVAILVRPDSEGQLSNTATVSADEADPNTESNRRAVTTNVLRLEADLDMAAVSSPAEVPVGEEFAYLIGLGNRGAGVARDAHLKIELPDGVAFRSAGHIYRWSGRDEYSADLKNCTLAGRALDCPLGDLGPTGEVPHRLAVQVTAPTQPGALVAHIEVRSSSSDPDGSNNIAAPPTNVVAAHTELAIRGRSVFPNPAIVEERISYQFEVINVGPSTARDVVVDLEVPDVSDVIAPADCSGSGRQRSCRLDPIPPHQTRHILIGTVPVRTGPMAVTASVRSSTPDEHPADNQAALTSVVRDPEADLVLALSSSPQTGAQVGDLVSYRAGVLNRGPTTARDTVVIGTAPEGTSILGTSPSRGRCSVSLAIVRCELDSLSAGDDATVFVTVRVDKAGQLAYSASVASAAPDPDGTNNAATVRAGTETGSADLVVSASATPDPVLPGETVTYRFLLNNAGPTRADETSLKFGRPKDQVILGLQSSSGFCSLGEVDVSCALGTLEVGSRHEVVLTARAGEVELAALTVTGSSATPDPIPANNQATASVALTAVRLVASAGDDQVGMPGAAIRFDASASVGLGQSGSFRWDFGDGGTAGTMVADHEYVRPGRYTVTLTVGTGTRSATDEARVEIVDPGSVGTGVRVQVQSEDQVPVAGAAVAVMDVNGTAHRAYTSIAGNTVIAGLTDGTHQVYVSAEGYRPSATSVGVRNGQGDVTISLVPGPVGEAGLTSHRMTPQQLVAAGLNPDDPANQHAYAFEMHLAGAPFTGYVTRAGLTGTYNGVGCGPSCEFIHGGYHYTVASQYAGDGAPTLVWMVVPGKATWLKEFFDVELRVTNLATQGFTFTRGLGQLRLPAGLVLAPVGSAQHLAVPFADVPAGQSRSAHWVIRGDVEGSYALVANYTGTLDPTGSAIALEGALAQPLRVWGASALEMVVDVDDSTHAAYPFVTRVGLKNVSDTPAYNVGLALRADGKQGYIYQPQERLTRTTNVLGAGQTFWSEFILVPASDKAIDLAQSFVVKTGGDSNLATTTTVHPTVTTLANAPEIAAVRETGAVRVRWAAIPGAAGYRLFKTPDLNTDFSGSPLLEVPAGQTEALLTGMPEGDQSFYAVSTLLAGVPTLRHPLVTAPIHPPGFESPTLPFSSRIGTRLNKPVEFTVAASDPDGETITIRASNLPALVTCVDVANPSTAPRMTCQAGPRLIEDTAPFLFEVVDPTGMTSVVAYTAGPALHVAVAGDSYINGEGTGVYLPGTDVHGGGENLCHRSEYSYAYRIAQDLNGQDEVPFFACTGATTGDFREGKQYGEGSQLDALARYGSENDGIDILLISIGGNDAYFSPIAQSCLALDACDQSVGIGFTALIPRAAAHVADLLRELKTKPHLQNATIYLMGYPSPVNPPSQVCPELYLPDLPVWASGIPGVGYLATRHIELGEQRWLDGVFIPTLNDQLEKAARQAGVHFITPEEYFRDHGICDPDPYTNGLTTGDDINLGIVSLGNESFHPTVAGHAAWYRRVYEDRVVTGRFQTEGNPLPDSVDFGPLPPPPLVGYVDGEGVYSWTSTGTTIPVTGPPGASVILVERSVPRIFARGTLGPDGTATFSLPSQEGLYPGWHVIEIRDGRTGELGSAVLIFVRAPQQCQAGAGDADRDGDGLADRCDSHWADGPSGDVDGDGVLNAADSCIITPNADQADGNGDGFGDACGPDLGTRFISTVEALGSPPVPRDDIWTASTGVSLIVPAPGVLTNDVDVDGEPLRSFLTSAPTHGTVILGESGGFEYRPESGWIGPDAFTYRAVDRRGHAVTAAVTVTTVTGPAGSTVIVASSANPSSAGQAVTFTATVAPSAATGMVTFRDGLTTLGTGSVEAGNATLTTSALAIGDHAITAAYGGDATNAASESTALTQTVRRPASGVTLTSSANPSSLGQQVIFTATVSPTGQTPSPSGTVTFRDGTAILGTGGVAAGTATYATSALIAGDHAVTATYEGDAFYSSATSATITQRVNLVASVTTLTSSANPTSIGQTTTFTATVTAGSGTPTGTVTFREGPAVLGVGALTAGKATHATSALSVGDHVVTATYDGDPTFSVSTSAALTQKVSRAATSAALTVSVNPSLLGQLVTFTATISPNSGSATPTGTVTFTDGEASLGTGPLSNGKASITTSALAVGDHAVVATYGGDAVTAPSVAAALTQRVLPPPPTATSTSLVSSVNPSTVGDLVTFTATVNSVSGTTAPTGTVTFRDGTATLGTASLAGGRATVATSALIMGDHTMSVTYDGSPTFAPSTSAALLQKVNGVQKAETSTALASSANPSSFGESVTLTATVTAPLGTAVPSGLVTFKDGSTILATTPLVSGAATLATSALAVGDHLLSAVYSGDAAFATSGSRPFTQKVNPVPSITSLVASPNPSTFGQQVTLAATVSGGSGSPTGTVIFKEGSTLVGSGPVVSGKASLATTSLSIGDHAITATYDGDGTFASSASQTLIQRVDRAPTTTTLTVGPSLATFGQPTTFTATVTAAAGAPTGTVEFRDGTTTLGTSVLSNGTATLTTSSLFVGPHAISAAYRGDATYAPSSSAPLSRAIGCSIQRGGAVRETITVKAGESLCLEAAAMKGSVIVEPGGAAWIRNSSIAGGIETRGAAAVALCDSKVAGAASIHDSAGPVVVGGPEGCKGNQLSGGITIFRNSGGVTVVANQVSGHVTVADNVSVASTVRVATNRIAGKLSCSGNSPVPVGGELPNLASGQRTGQCASR
jgi:uncharacterized repeat protein (TIGR01451 family)